MSAGMELTTGNFAAEVEKSTIPVLVDFWAEWCGPCRSIAPHIDALAAQYAGRLKVGKVNVDQEPDLAGRFGIVSIPTLIVFKDGAPVRQRLGAVPARDIENLFKDLV